MPYVRCPGCGLLAHVLVTDHPAIHCPRCRTDERHIVLEPLEESLDLKEQPGEPPNPAG
jgi:phage FluMu protein Com